MSSTVSPTSETSSIHPAPEVGGQHRRRSKRRGTNWDWTCSMAGVQLTGKAETVDYVPGKRFGFRTSGIDSTFSYQAEPDGSRSKLTVRVSYEVPKSVLAKIADRAVVVRTNEKEPDQAANNLQTILDSQ